MATLPTKEEMERVILSIFEEFNVRPGEMLMANTFQAKIPSSGYRMEDFDLGINSLVEKGFVEIKNGNPPCYFLTLTGFEAM